MCLPNHVEEGSPTWESALESIELSLGLGDIRDCCHRYVLDDEFASYSEVDLLWCCLPMGFSWSLFFVQMTNEEIMSSCLGPTGSHIMNDRTLPAIVFAGNGQKKQRAPTMLCLLTTLGSSVCVKPR